MDFSNTERSAEELTEAARLFVNLDLNFDAAQYGLLASLGFAALFSLVSLIAGHASSHPMPATESNGANQSIARQHSSSHARHQNGACLRAAAARGDSWEMCAPQTSQVAWSIVWTRALCSRSPECFGRRRMHGKPPLLLSASWRLRDFSRALGRCAHKKARGPPRDCLDGGVQSCFFDSSCGSYMSSAALAQAFGNPASFTALGKLVPPERRATANGIYSSGARQLGPRCAASHRLTASPAGLTTCDHDRLHRFGRHPERELRP